MNRLFPVTVALTAAVLLASSHATADVRSIGAKIRWVGALPEPARAGQAFHGRFEVESAQPGMLENLRIEGLGWSVQAPEVPGRQMMMRGGRREFAFTATPQNAREPLVISATFDGRPIRKTLRLDAASLERAGRRGRVAYRDGAPRLTKSVTPRTQDQAIHFTGRFTYMRGGATPVELGADNIVVRIWDDDSPDPFDEVIWEGSTDVNGYFDVNVNWDDCDLTGCDNPDIYVEFIASSQVVDVQTDDITETTYSWESAIIDNFTGNEIAFGTMMPDDSGEYGAVHVYNGVMRAARYAALHGMVPPPLDCQWPDDDGSFYNQFFQEMHISAEATWIEGTHHHEFGHHLQKNFSVLVESNYQNGFCDAGTPDGGHCLWCPENDQDAWQEGWANWFGSFVNRSYTNTYGIIPVSIEDERYVLESIDRCNEDLQLHPGPFTEGYIGALLRDIDDEENDDHDGEGFDCDIDAMSIGDEAIMTVFREDDPGDVWQFLNAFRARYPEHDQDLWSTVRNVWTFFTFPLPTPMVLSQPQDCAAAHDSVVISVQANGSLLQYQWRKDGVPVADGLGGVQGATTPTLRLDPLGPNSGGSYNCLITTCDGTLSVLSTPCRVTVLDAPVPRGLVSWGENLSYQVGDGTNTWHVTLTDHPSIPDMLFAEGGRGHTVALAEDGTVYTWGNNDAGQCGAGWGPPRTTPGPIAITNAVQVAAGGGHSMALLRDGSLVGWGDNFRGQLGDSTFSNRSTPVLTKGLDDGCVIAVACGLMHTLVLMADGTVRAFGINEAGVLGQGTDGGRFSYPLPVPGLTDVVAISAAGYVSMALKSDGTVWGWGQNYLGQLGNGNTGPALTPTQVVGLTNIRSIAAGTSNGYAIGEDGNAWSWGTASLGQLGDGNGAIGGRAVPGLMPDVFNADKIVTGDGNWAGALMPNRTVKVWGYNAEWINGTSSPGAIWLPETVEGIVAVSSLGAGWATVHACGNLGSTTSAPTAAAPTVLALRAFPNPSLAATRIAFDLPRSGRVSLAIYDLAGRRVQTVVEGERAAGRYVETWNGRDAASGPRMAGVFFARLVAEGRTLTERIVRIR